QGITGYASGGRVRGSSPNPKADNIPAMLTAGEWVQPVSSVRYFGSEVMEAIRTRRIPKEAIEGALHLANGGPVYQGLFDLVKKQFPKANLNSGQRAS
ncbi:hypothetical protein, partial [Salmonella enterica]|uniref:hypothetical protein n=1 Tax=Salmonella enterica TaxID=28901 RepID=UPI0032978979